MKAIKIIACILISLVVIYAVVFAYGQMMTVYKRSEEVINYEVINQKNLDGYVSDGWSTTPGFYDTSTHTPMYSDDKRVEIVPNEYVEAQKTVWWHTSPRKTMHSFDNRVINVNIEDIGAYESVYWFTEQPALMVKGNETKYVVESEIQSHRENGWNIKEYAELYHLGTKIKDYIANKRGQYGVYIKNLNTDECLVLNDGNYSAASIIKLFVMAGVYNELGYDEVNRNSNVLQKLNSMITVSDNYSSNFLVKTTGRGNYLNGFNSENENTKSLGCTITQHLSLFSGCGDYVSYGRNWVSPVDCGIVLEKIYKGTLVDKKSSDQMLGMLKNQQRRNKIPQGLPKGTVCANKTGETSSIESDVAIVYSPKCDYIICVTSSNSPTGANDIKKISQMTYNYFNS